jgi:hypothetical protein
MPPVSSVPATVGPRRFVSALIDHGVLVSEAARPTAARFSGRPGCSLDARLFPKRGA